MEDKLEKQKENELRGKLVKMTDEELKIEIIVALNKIEAALSGSIPAALTNHIAPELKKIVDLLKSTK